MGSTNMTPLALYRVNLVIFTCEGREQLVYDTYNSFKSSCNYPFSKTVLAIDGKIKPEVIDHIQPDLVVQSPVRKGYVNNIIQSLSAIESDYFFWLEDDWKFPFEIPLEKFLRLLDSSVAWQVVLSKNDLDKTNVCYEVNFYFAADGFSANPGICKTWHVKKAFIELQQAEKSSLTQLVGFETFLTRYAQSNGLKTLKYFADGHASVRHSGELESTAREYHMINSIDEQYSSINKEYISGFGYDRKITVGNKLLMMFKLWAGTISLSIKLWYLRNAYDFAFRIYLGHKKKFKN
jgi:hypothetical protein